MARIQVTGFNHTSFTVTNLENCVGFFRDLLGFELESMGPRAPGVIEGISGIPGARITVAMLDGYGHRMELIEYNGPENRGSYLPPVCDAGATHIALNVADMDAALEGAREYGFAPLGKVILVDAGPNKGRRVVYLRNPDGLTVEFLEFPTES